MCHKDQLGKIVPVLHRIFILVGFVRIIATDDCTLPECIFHENRLKESIDESIDPCDDFVEFACGKQFKKFEDMKSTSDLGILDPTTYRLHLWRIRKTLENKLTEPNQHNDSQVMKLAKRFWHRCKMSTSEDALTGVRILLNRLGGWPLITNSWNGIHFTWDKFSQCARRLGFLPRMFMYIGLDVDNVRKVWDPNDTITLTIERPKYIDALSGNADNTMQDIGYYTIAEFIAEGKSPVESEIQDALNFAQQLYELDCDVDEKRSEIMSIIQLQRRFPVIDWFKHIKAMMRSRQAKYLSDYNCIIVDVCYISAFTRYITVVDKKIQANYAFLSIINDLFSLIRPQLGLAFADNTPQEIIQICFDTTSIIFKKALDEIIGRMNDEKLIETMKEVESLVNNMTIHLFYTVPWMDEKTRDIARRKLDLISFQNPFTNDNFNDHYFHRLDFKSSDSLNVMLREMNIFLVDNYYLQAGRPKNQYGIYQEAEEVMRATFQVSSLPNIFLATSDIFDYTVYMPATINLQERLSTYKELDFINYASIGVQYGEALSHHIYRKGAHVDADGNWHMDTWWSEATKEQFMSRQSCQAIGPVKPIADASSIFGLIGGMEIAYMSMFNNCLNTSCITTFKGLKYNTRQLFWLTFVASDCDKNLRLRYNTLLSHNDDFERDFTCGNHSKQMYITNKCKMWTH